MASCELGEINLVEIEGISYKEEPKKIMEDLPRILETEDSLNIPPVENLQTMESHHSCPTMEKQRIRLLGESNTMFIVTAGLSRRGKSTALNNIFDCNFDNKYSASSVTTGIQKLRSEGDKDTLVVVDTPGLASADIPLAKVKKDIHDAVGGLDFVLLYCHSVSPSNALSNDDKLVIKNLQKVLGKDIWKKCVVLFTFSDFLRQQECPTKNDRDRYRCNLCDHATKLTDLLKTQCGQKVPDVKVVFEVFDKVDVPEIVAIPVGRELKIGEENELVPGIPDLNWKEVAFLEIMRREEPMHHKTFSKLYGKFNGNNPIYLSSAVGAGVGVTVGVVGGALLGALAGGIGAAPGAAVGAVAGGVVGGMAGSNVTGVGAFTFKELLYRYKSYKLKHKIEKLKSAKLINYQAKQENTAEDRDRQHVPQHHEGRLPPGMQLPREQLKNDAQTAMHY